MLLRLVFSSLVFFLVTSLVFSQTTVKGFVVTLKGDTLRGDLTKAAKAREDKRLSSIQVTLINEAGESIRYLPNELRGYVKGETVFKTFAEGDKHVFAEQLTTGRALLYFDASESRYFFKKSKDNEYFVMNANAPVPRRLGAAVEYSRSTREGPDLPIITDPDKTFREYFSVYFNDCLKLSRMIKMEYYSRTDMKDMFVEYNNACK